MDVKELESIIQEEKDIYITNYFFQKYTHSKMYIIWKLLSNFRKAQYYKEMLKNARGITRFILKVKIRHFLRLKNIYSEKSGIEIANNCKIGRRLLLWHGGVVINANLGDDCAIHGNNILGNKGLAGENEIPTLGDNVDVGVGAILIGKINIADDCKIGANAVVTKSFDTPGSVIVGVPGRLLEKG